MIAALIVAQALNLARLDGSAPNHIQLSTGAEYGVVSGAGYAREVGPVLVGGELSIPWGGLDAGDWRVRASALMPFSLTERWRVAGSLAPTLRATSDDAARLLGVGLDLGAVGGYYAPGWFAALELGYDWSIAAHVTSSAAYRALVYADAQDGWYRTPGGNLRAGAQLGLSFSRADVVLRAGKMADLTGKAPMLPFFATLSVDTRF